MTADDMITLLVAAGVTTVLLAVALGLLVLWLHGLTRRVDRLDAEVRSHTLTQWTETGPRRVRATGHSEVLPRRRDVREAQR